MSCDEWFDDQPDHWRPMADAVIDHLVDLGDVVIDPVDVGLLVKKRRTFVELRPVRADLRLSMIHSHEIRDPRITRGQRLSGSRWVHFVDLAGVDDTDDQILGWLTESHLDSPDA